MAPAPPAQGILMRELGLDIVASGARKEKLRQRDFKRAPKAAPRPYVELHAASAFSFLDGASLPEHLVARAAACDLSAVAVIDTNGVYGAPRFYGAAKKAGVRALVGAEIVLDESWADFDAWFRKRRSL